MRATTRASATSRIVARAVYPIEYVALTGQSDERENGMYAVDPIATLFLDVVHAEWVRRSLVYSERVSGTVTTATVDALSRVRARRR